MSELLCFLCLVACVFAFFSFRKWSNMMNERENVINEWMEANKRWLKIEQDMIKKERENDQGTN